MRGMVFFFTFMLLLATVGCTDEKDAAHSAQVITTPPSAPPGINTAEAKFLYETKCSSCHSLDRPASKRKSHHEWLSTVHRMIGNGAPVTDEEAEVIATYLAQMYGKE